MEIKTASLLRIFIGELDKVHHRPMYEEIVYKAKDAGLLGATVMRGIMSYGGKHHMHTIKILDLSEDLPIIIEIVDEQEKIKEFIPVVNEMLEKAGTGALITIESNVNYIFYPSKKK